MTCIYVAPGQTVPCDEDEVEHYCIFVLGALIAHTTNGVSHQYLLCREIEAAHPVTFQFSGGSSKHPFNPQVDLNHEFQPGFPIPAGTHL